MNFYKKITITIFSILVVFGLSVGISSAFIGPDVGQNPGTGGGLFYVDPDRNIGFGTESPSIGTNAEGSPWGYTFTVASSSNPGLSLLNTSASGKQYSFYSHDSGSFGLFDGTAGEVRLRVTSNGNIGVGGTNTPQSLFHVFGTSEATSFTGSGVNLTNIDPQNFIAGSSFNSGNYAVDGSLGVGTSSVTAAPSNGLYVDGNVGIGTTNPSSPLQVNQTGEAIGIGGGSYVDTYIRFRPDSGGSGYFGISNNTYNSTDTLLMQSGGGGKEIAFAVSSDTFGGVAPSMVIDSSGNVGIGTTGPNTKLEIMGPSGSGAVDLLSLAKSGGYGSTKFEQYYVSSLNFGLRVNGGGGTLIETNNDVDGGNGGVYFPNGNVGIGTTTPASKLTVNGTIETLSGGITFPDGTTQTTAGGGGGGGDAVGWDRDDNNGYVHLATSTDSVGIGDATPSVKLDVNGSIYSNVYYDKDNDNYYVNPSSVSNLNDRININVNGQALQVKGNATGTSYMGWVRYEEGDGTRAGYIGFGSSGNRDLDIYNDSGSVDLSSNGGTGRLTIESDGDINVNSDKIINLATPTASSDAATKSYVDSTAGGGVPSGSDGQTLYNSGGDWAATSNLYHDGTNVGIGTTNPDDKLEVEGGIHVDSNNFRVNYGTYTGSWGRGYLVQNSDASDNYGFIGNYNNDSIRYLRIGKYADDGNSLYWTSSGQVGIGDSSPSVKLDVNGSIYGSTLYDKDNTSYYVNPSGSSYVNDINLNGTGDILSEQSSHSGVIQEFEGSDNSLDFRHYQDGTQVWLQVNWNGGNGAVTIPDASYLDMSTNNIINGGNIFGTTFYDENNTTYYTNPSGTSNINGLTVNGNWTLSGAAQADVDLSSNDLVGVNKITVGTIDPLYKINGQKYATYVPDTIGLKTEIYGKADLQKEFTGNESPKFSHTIDFDQVEEGSDLWVFWKTINLKDDMSDMIVSLTPEGSNADIWYELDSNENQLVIRSDKLATVSYHLVAPRHDSDEWPTKTDTEEEPSFIFEEGEWIK